MVSRKDLVELRQLIEDLYGSRKTSEAAQEKLKELKGVEFKTTEAYNRYVRRLWDEVFTGSETA